MRRRSSPKQQRQAETLRPRASLNRGYEAVLLRQVASIRRMLMPVWRDLFASLRNGGSGAASEQSQSVDAMTATLEAIEKARSIVAANYRPDVDFGLIARPIIESSQSAINKVLAEDGRIVSASIKPSAKADAPKIREIDAIKGRELVVKAWTEENTKLVKSIPVEGLDRLAARVVASVRPGSRVETIAKMIESEFGPNVHTGCSARAMLIARTEVSKLNAQIQRSSMEASGARRYVWNTSNDERVRRDHDLLEGEPFSWDDPPIIDSRTGERGAPGMIYNCRCVALPLYDELPDESELDAEIAELFNDD